MPDEAIDWWVSFDKCQRKCLWNCSRRGDSGSGRDECGEVWNATA